VFNLLWLLPIRFVLLIVAIALFAGNIHGLVGVLGQGFVFVCDK
jgi:hypothetical protein